MKISYLIVSLIIVLIIIYFIYNNVTERLTIGTLLHPGGNGIGSSISFTLRVNDENLYNNNVTLYTNTNPSVIDAEKDSKTEKHAKSNNARKWDGAKITSNKSVAVAEKYTATQSVSEAVEAKKSGRTLSSTKNVIITDVVITDKVIPSLPSFIEDYKFIPNCNECLDLYDDHPRGFIIKRPQTGSTGAKHEKDKTVYPVWNKTYGICDFYYKPNPDTNSNQYKGWTQSSTDFKFIDPEKKINIETLIFP